MRVLLRRHPAADVCGIGRPVCGIDRPVYESMTPEELAAAIADQLGDDRIWWALFTPGAGTAPANPAEWVRHRTSH